MCRSGIVVTLWLLLPMLNGAEPWSMCPGSPAWIHASAKVKVNIKASCQTVLDEMIARVQAQSGEWHDPHNNGRYRLLAQGKTDPSTLFANISRTTGNGKYTDKLGFRFYVTGTEQCGVHACSESQVTSIADFSTNYCNLRNLYCGSAEGCKPVNNDFAVEETAVETSKGAGKDAKKCIVADAATEQLLSTPGNMLAKFQETWSMCPGSPAWVHASAKVKVIAKASCQTVLDEMVARVQAQGRAWHDPHNTGLYMLLAQGKNDISTLFANFSRVTGNGKYTDKLGFRFFVTGTEQCGIHACSESQVTSIADFSTNYCNLRNLYCGSAEGCKPMKSDFAVDETTVETSRGASKDAKKCNVARGSMLYSERNETIIV